VLGDDPEYAAQGVGFTRGLGNTPWHCREFVVKDSYPPIPCSTLLYPAPPSYTLPHPPIPCPTLPSLYRLHAQCAYYPKLHPTGIELLHFPSFYRSVDSLRKKMQFQVGVVPRNY